MTEGKLPGKKRRRPNANVIRQALLAATLMMAWQVAAKVTRDSLFLSVFKPSALPPMIGGAAVFSILLALLSARLLRRYGPFRIIPMAYLLGGLLHGAEWLLLPIFPRPVSVFVYIHVIGLGSVLLSGFWALASERFDPREARRRFGQIAAFGTLGSLAGGLIAERVATLTSSSELLLLLTLLQVACFFTMFRLAPARPVQRERDTQSFPDVISGAPYLALLVTLVCLAAMSAATLDYLFKFQAVTQFGRGAPLSRFFALFYASTSAATFGFQIGVSRIWLKRFGPGRTVAVLPVAVTGASIVALIAPGAMTLFSSRALEQLLRGSLYRSGYELFFTPMPEAEKRSTKSLIDIGADRLGEGLAGAAIQLLLVLPAEISSRAILALTAILSGLATWLAFRMDRAYVAVLEKGLASHTVTIGPEEAQDNLTQSILLRSLPSSPMAGKNAPPATEVFMPQLAALRSGDPIRVMTVLQQADPLDPILVPQVIALLGRDDVCRAAHASLLKVADRIAGQLVDVLKNESADYRIRRRVPRILASCEGWLAWNGLFEQLRDERFEIRFRCAQALENIQHQHPEYRIDQTAVFEIVGKELSAAQKLGQKLPVGDSYHDGHKYQMVDKVLVERASQSLAHVFTLLGLVLPPQPVRLAFRALRTKDAQLRGVALEYLDSVLPKALREQLCTQIECPPEPVQSRVRAEDALAQLMESSPSIMARLDEMGFEPADHKDPRKRGT